MCLTSVCWTSASWRVCAIILHFLARSGVSAQQATQGCADRPGWSSPSVLRFPTCYMQLARSFLAIRRHPESCDVQLTFVRTGRPSTDARTLDPLWLALGPRSYGRSMTECTRRSILMLTLLSPCNRLASARSDLRPSTSARPHFCSVRAFICAPPKCSSIRRQVMHAQSNSDAPFAHGCWGCHADPTTA